MPCKKEEDEVNIFEEQEDYSRDGHLFRERFKSEPVNDMAYFVTLLRYIHQNPEFDTKVVMGQNGDLSFLCQATSRRMSQRRW